MKILFLINSMAGGGAERLLQTLGTGLSNSGHEITILTLEEPQSAYRLPPQVIVRGLRTKFLSRGVLKLLAMPLFAVEFSIQVKREKPDAVISLMPRSNFVAILGKVFHPNVRTVLSEHVSIFSAYPPNTIHSKVMVTLMKVLYPRSDAIVAVSHGVERSLRERVLSNRIPITVIYNALDLALIRKEAKQEGLPFQDWTQSAPTVVNLGRLCAQKDQRTLLRAFALVRASVPEAQLLIIGQGEDLEGLKALSKELGISDRTCFAGWQSNPYALVSRAKVFAFSSRYEGFGIALVEAMACGVPVVSTDCEEGPGEIIGSDRFGLLALVEDPYSLARSLVTLLTEPETHAYYKGQALQRAEDFDVSKILGDFLAVAKGI